MLTCSVQAKLFLFFLCLSYPRAHREAHGDDLFFCSYKYMFTLSLFIAVHNYTATPLGQKHILQLFSTIRISYLSNLIKI